MSSLRTDPPLAASEADNLRDHLDYHRDTLRMKTEGLGQEQLARRHPPSELTLGGLLKHAALNEDWWFVRVSRAAKANRTGFRPAPSTTTRTGS